MVGPEPQGLRTSGGHIALSNDVECKDWTNRCVGVNSTTYHAYSGRDLLGFGVIVPSLTQLNASADGHGWGEMCYRKGAWMECLK